MYQKFIERVKEVVAQANEIYTLNMNPEIRVDIKGTRIAGQAGRKLGKLIIRLNPLFCEQSPEHMLNDTIPHEVAHLVCYCTGLGKGHDAGWKRVAKKLGSTGKTYHNECVIGNKPEVFVVFGDEKIKIGMTRYKKIMNSGIRYNSNFGPIDSTSTFLIVQPDGKSRVMNVQKKVEEIAAKVETKNEVIDKKVETSETKVIEPKAKADKIQPKPAKVNAAFYAEVNGNFEEFAKLLSGKTAQYIKDQFLRAKFHA